MTETITSSHTPAWRGQFSRPCVLAIRGTWGAATAVAVHYRPVSVDGSPAAAGDTTGAAGATFTPTGDAVVRFESAGRYELRFVATGADGSTNLVVTAAE